MSAVEVRIPPKLIPVFTGEADVRGSHGGRGSAKTRTFAKMTAIRAYMWDMAGREGQIVCARQFMNSLAESSMEEIKAAIRSEPWLLERFEIGEKFIRTKSRRITYSFVGLDRNIDSIKSKARILLAWVDEAEPVTEEAWSKLIPTLREEDSELWVTWNPESKRSPTHKRFRDNPDPRYKIVEMNFRDNPWFPSVLERTRQRDLRERPEEYPHIWEGQFATIFKGAYYAKEMAQAANDNRIGAFPYDPALPVHTAWDLGVGDSTAIWFFQTVGNEVRIIDYYENHGFGLPHYIEVLKERGYVYGTDWVPHDAKVREFGTGKTRIEQMIEGGRNPKVVAIHSIEDGIAAVRKILANCWFDAEKVEDGLATLRQYRSEFDEDKQVFSDRPLHDWTSHGADAFRYLAMAYLSGASPAEEPKKPLFKSLNEITYGELAEIEDFTERRARA